MQNAEEKYLSELTEEELEEERKLRIVDPARSKIYEEEKKMKKESDPTGIHRNDSAIPPREFEGVDPKNLGRAGDLDASIPVDAFAGQSDALIYKNKVPASTGGVLGVDMTTEEQREQRKNIPDELNIYGQPSEPLQPPPNAPKTEGYSLEEVREIVQKKWREEHGQPDEPISDEEKERRRKNQQKLIVVTGAAGFMGSHLVRALNSAGREDLLLVDDLSDPAKLKNISNCVFQDYSDKSKFLELFAFIAENGMVERIYHLGAESDRNCQDGKYLMENNFQYTANLMDLCHMHKIPMVYASSAAVYGQSKTFDDTTDNYVPESYYALSKLQADRYQRKFTAHAESRIVGLRYFNVVSEGEYEQHKGDMKSAVAWMTEQFDWKGEIELFEGSKNFRRDFVHVKAAIWMTMNAMDKGRSGIYNIGTGTARSFYDMAMEICEDDQKIKYIPMPEEIAKGYQKLTKANMDNACFGITTRP